MSDTSQGETSRHERTRTQVSMIEAALYVTGKPLDVGVLGSILNLRSEEKIRTLAAILKEKYAQNLGAGSPRTLRRPLRYATETRILEKREAPRNEAAPYPWPAQDTFIHRATPACGAVTRRESKRQPRLWAREATERHGIDISREAGKIEASTDDPKLLRLLQS